MKIQFYARPSSFLFNLHRFVVIIYAFQFFARIAYNCSVTKTQIFVLRQFLGKFWYYNREKIRTFQYTFLIRYLGQGLVKVS